MKKLTTALTVIAMVAITWYLCTYYGATNSWWTLPVVAGIITLFTVFLPVWIKRIKPFWSIISTGLTLLLLQTLSNAVAFNSFSKFWVLTAIIFIIAVITELLAHGPGIIHLGDLILDFVVSLLTAWLIISYSNPLATLFCLIIAFIVIIVIDFRVKFSIKRTNSIDTTSNESIS